MTKLSHFTKNSVGVVINEKILSRGNNCCVIDS